VTVNFCYSKSPSLLCFVTATPGNKCNVSLNETEIGANRRNCKISTIDETGSLTNTLHLKRTADPPACPNYASCHLAWSPCSSLMPRERGNINLIIITNCLRQLALCMTCRQNPNGHPKCPLSYSSRQPCARNSIVNLVLGHGETAAQKS
jgi:hypothetical protein